MKELDIGRVINLAKNRKYEITVACFDVVENLPLLDVPRSMKGRKRAVQALSLLSDGEVQYGYNETKAPQKSEPIEK